MNIIQLIILTFIVYRLSVMIAEDIGPWRVFERIRKHFAAGSTMDEGIHCVGCVSMWVAGLIALGGVIIGRIDVSQAVVECLFASGGAIFLNRLASCPK